MNKGVGLIHNIVSSGVKFILVSSFCGIKRKADIFHTELENFSGLKKKWRSEKGAREKKRVDETLFWRTNEEVTSQVSRTSHALSCRVIEAQLYDVTGLPNLFPDSSLYFALYSRSQSRLSLLVGWAWCTRNKWLWGHMTWLDKIKQRKSNQISRFNCHSL